MAADLGEDLLTKLRLATPVLARVMNGASGVLEAGALTPRMLTDYDAQRTAAGTPAQVRVLALVVVDRGEQARQGQVAASVFIYDRHRGYTNIRAVRELVISALAGCPVTLPRGTYVVKTDLEGRSGHLQDDMFDLDLERIDFTGALAGTLTTDNWR